MKKLKEIMRTLWPDWETEKKLREYRDDFFIYWYDLDGENSRLEDRMPLYTTMEDYARALSIGYMGFFVIACIVLGVIARDASGAAILILVGCIICCGILAFLARFPNDYWRDKRKYRKIRVLRLFTEKTMAQFEADRELLEDAVRDYKEQQAKEKADKEAKEARRQQTEREKEARLKAEAKAKFLPQFMALLGYVETNFGITTPAPERFDGKFAILLPCVDSEKLKEHVFDYSLEEVERLVAIISNIDATMRKRAELRALVAGKHD